MKQEQATKIFSDDGKLEFLISGGVPIGEVHDFVTNLDALVINRINEAKEDRTKPKEGAKTDIKAIKEDKNEV